MMFYGVYNIKLYVQHLFHWSLLEKNEVCTYFVMIFSQHLTFLSVPFLFDCIWYRYWRNSKTFSEFYSKSTIPHSWWVNFNRVCIEIDSSSWWSLDLVPQVFIFLMLYFVIYVIANHSLFAIDLILEYLLRIKCV